MINQLKALLNHTINQGGYKMPCAINPGDTTEMNTLLLFYSDDLSANLATGKHTNSLFLSQGFEIASRHNIYDDSRALCLKAIKHLGQNREQINMSIYINDSVPIYKGVDDTGGHVFSFTVKARGSEN